MTLNMIELLILTRFISTRMVYHSRTCTRIVYYSRTNVYSPYKESALRAFRCMKKGAVNATQLLGVTTLSNLVKVKYNLTPHIKVFTQYTYMSLFLCVFSFRVTHCKIFTADTSGNAILGPGPGLGVTVCKRCYCQSYRNLTPSAFV